MNKKAQGEIITTVLIILLVLAAIVIVWQVVNRTVTKSGEQVTSQSECLGYSAATTLSTDKKSVSMVPNKAITGYRVYVNGQNVTGNDSIGVSTYSSSTYYNAGGGAWSKDTKIKTAALINGQWCEGMDELTVP